ncbi:uncharacterized protein LOC123550711 [Mercenaria mercenaria]|uniref:uncharacterized protein LOC123550711 n=1 Tax=Mercenaria mercenaria TaxID=6596 RepID=UPI00234E75F0|nr:uncharacterized protein LOC123550711 [Mercenaria mercenaria]
MHPETVFNKEVGRMMRNSRFRDLVCCTVVDEVHMISEWGTEFRKCFERLGELTCLFPNIPHLALTATASPNAISSLIETLQMRNTTRVLANPDRPNIYIEQKERLSNIHKYEKYDAILCDITQEIKEKKSDFPVTIMYCDNLESLGYCFQYLTYELGKDAYIPVGSSDPENRIVAQYHKDYTENMKLHIINELRKETPKLRLVLATVALGMGLNAPSISRIVHMRPPTTLEKYLQEIGRAGRNGQKAVAKCYFNNSDIAKNRKGLDNAMVLYIKNNETCLRLQLVQHFGYHNTLFKGDPTNCCSNCRSAAEQKV